MDAQMLKKIFGHGRIVPYSAHEGHVFYFMFFFCLFGGKIILRLLTDFVQNAVFTDPCAFVLLALLCRIVAMADLLFIEAARVLTLEPFNI